jgi:phosphatidylserine decarboxylase
MARKHHPRVAREGWPLILIALGSAVIAWIFGTAEWALPGVVVAFALALKLRDPERQIPPEPLGVVSPVDGTVESVETVHHACFDRETVRIRIRIARFGAYSARAPVEGRIGDLNGNGKRGQAPRGMWLRTDEGDDVMLAINTAPSFARPRSMVDYGSRVGQGQRVARLRLARIAEVYLPVASKILVEPGRRVLAGSELLAQLVHD